MKRIGTTTWNEIFQDWKSREASNPGWIHTATVVKGWPDWESWRSFTADQLRLPSRTWTVYELTDPMTEIPSMLVGPHTGWQSRLPRPNVHSFADLANIPEQYEYYMANTKVSHLFDHWPSDTQFLGLKRPDSRIVCVEGHHRALAVALAAHNKQKISFGKVRLVLADLTDSEDGLLDKVLARGSTKEPPH